MIANVFTPDPFDTAWLVRNSAAIRRYLRHEYSHIYLTKQYYDYQFLILFLKI